LLDVEKLDLSRVAKLEDDYIRSLLEGKPDILLESKEIKSNTSVSHLFENLTHSAIWDSIKIAGNIALTSADASL
jgi:hypothetical protein